ncbi:MAG: penicillin-binding protein [Methylobacteriaceae bacterium]|nr:penicillin-binding protein [Methylobacteriaceae bacterium]
MRGKDAGAGRREPTLGVPGGPPELRVSAQDRRATSTARSKGERIEPSVGVPGRWADLRATRDEGDAPPFKEGARPSAPTLATREPPVRHSEEDDTPQRRSKRGKGARDAKRRRSFLGRLFYWGFVLGVWAFIAVAGIVAYYATQLPPIDQLAVPKRPPNIAILAEDGTLLANRGDTGGPAISLKELPPYLPKAFIAIEDRRFYSHWGIDPFGIMRALVRNVTGKSLSQGGSTLTQQLAKNLFLTQERTMSRKIQEAILAIWLEHKYTKDQILELYLNRVYFGSGAYGVEAAAQKYFGKSARAVTLSEAAVLAGLMKSPSKLAPNRNPQGASDRAAQVIDAMAQEGFITEAMAKVALAKPAQAVREKSAGSVNYAADYVMDALDDTVGAIDEDIVVTTTISPQMQNAAERALDEELAAKGQKFGVSQGALVALDLNGGVRALIGGRDYSDSQFDRAVAAKRQPGSSFKPFVYLTALEHGLTPDTVREDKPLNLKGWQPENASREYRGAVTLTQGLALSINTVAVELGLEVGPKNVVKTAHRLGIQSDLNANASIALGTSEVTPLEMVTAYTAFANGGIGVQPHVITKVATAKGKPLYQRKAGSFGRLIEPQYVAMMNSMLQETLLTGTARKADLPGWQAAGKTGTSQDYRDAWFIGYTSHLVCGVWLGNDDSSPTRKTSGANLPVDIWSRFMRVAHQGVPPAGLPGGVWTNSEPAVASTQTPADVAAAQGLPIRDPATGRALTWQPPAPPANVGATGEVDGGATAPAPRPAALRRDPGAPLPPAPIPGEAGDDVGMGQERQPSLFERLFGG